MATTAKIGPQDLPPSGGYANIKTERVKLKSIIGWKVGVAWLVATHFIGWVNYNINYRRRRREIVEMRSARFAILPVLLAERDRAFLKQVRKNRDEEADLMKDYPGWEVGKYFDEPIFKTLPENSFVEPSYLEYSIHAPPYGNFYTRGSHRGLT